MTPSSCCTSFDPSSGAADSGERLPVAIVGAGPVGLAAAAHLVRRKQAVVVLEAGPRPGTTIREWSHVRLFSPWDLCLDPVAAEMLDEAGWEPPDPGSLPTGGELVARYLEPLAELPAIEAVIRYGHRVTGISREDHDRLAGTDRADTPFVVRYRTEDGTSDRLRARAVIDASGTWNRPRPLGADGLPVLGEEAAADRVHYGIPDVLGSDRDAFAGQRVAVVGAGHSAANVLLDLDRLAGRAPGTRPLWILRGGRPERLFDGADDDELEARGALERRLRQLVEANRVEMISSFGTRAVEERDDGLVLEDGAGRRVEAQRAVAVTGFRPDLEILDELRLDLDPVTEAPRELGPLIDPNVHSCGTVPPHGEAELRHPEPGFYLVGMKSYGRAPTFLLPTGYEQVRSVAAALAGDMEAARRVELALPGTGVCSADAALEADEAVSVEAMEKAAPAPEAEAAVAGAGDPAGDTEACCV